MKDKIKKCPCCGGPLERGFAHKVAGLSFVRPEKFRGFAFLDEDLQGAGLANILPSRARYCPSFLCRACRVYIVAYGTTLSRKSANEAARALEAQEPWPNKVGRTDGSPAGSLNAGRHSRAPRQADDICPAASHALPPARNARDAYMMTSTSGQIF